MILVFAFFAVESSFHATDTDRLNTRRLQYFLLLMILLLAFTLRVYRIDASALRGDEAFAVRYWAAPPSEVLQQLAWIEPHPFGTFFGFWAWKSLVGESELAMRMLPALLNLLGAAAMYALARRLRMGAWAALLAAFLWAVNPGLIWHSQDVRNYAPWAGLSAVALWLLVRAADKRRRIDWVLYVILEVITLYVFFLEAFMLVVQGLYVLWVAWQGREKREDVEGGGRGMPRPYSYSAVGRWDGRLLRGFAASAVVMGVLLIPWLYQAYRLAGSGYGGTAERARLDALLEFVSEWTLQIPGTPALDLGLCGVLLVPLLVFSALTLVISGSRASKLSLLMLVVLPLLLIIAATRLDVFRARYLLAIMPALLLIAASSVLWFLPRYHRPLPPWSFLGMMGAMYFAAVILLYGVFSVAFYFDGRYPKAPDWRALSHNLSLRLDDEDAVIVAAADLAGTTDPAFEYYYQGDFVVLPRENVEVYGEAAGLLTTSRLVYLVDGVSEDSAADAALRELGTFAEEYFIRGYRVRVFHARGRPSSVVDSPAGADLSELEHPVWLQAAGRVLSGWELVGYPFSDQNVSVLLLWNDVSRSDETSWKVFLHLVDTSGQIVLQADRPPGSTVGYDLYNLIVPGLAPGDYTLRFGLYREDTGERAIITDAGTAETLGDYVDLATITVEPGS